LSSISWKSLAVLHKLKKGKTKLIEKYPLAKPLYERLKKLEQCIKLIRTLEKKYMDNIHA
jgi:hypothetical protein